MTTVRLQAGSAARLTRFEYEFIALIFLPVTFSSEASSAQFQTPECSADKITTTVNFLMALTNQRKKSSTTAFLRSAWKRDGIDTTALLVLLENGTEKAEILLYVGPTVPQLNIFLNCL